jgi:hypothetical protein
MAARFESIGVNHRAFIEKQHVFFVASAAPGAHINLSPKGLDCLRVLDERTAIYLDMTGSGNETAAHLKADGRLTFMFCAFEGPPLILRLYGRGRVIPRCGADYADLLTRHFNGEERVGARQMIRLDVDLVLTSCGYAVPNLQFRSERPGLDNWAAQQGKDGLAAYRRQKNMASLDGLPTGFVEADS